MQQLTVGGYQLGGQEVVDRQPVLANEESDSAASVSPPIPTEPVSPNPVARPWAAAAVV
jgi:hypothetical protein